MSDAGRSMFIDEMARHETLQCKGLGQFMRATICDGMCHHPTRTWCCFETTCSPTAVDEQVLDRGEPDDRRGIGCDINDAAPCAQHVCTGENREQFNRRCQLVFDHMEATALCIRVEGVGTC